MTEQKILTEEEIKERQDYCDEIRPVVFGGGESSLLSICDSLFLHIRALAAERDRLKPTFEHLKPGPFVPPDYQKHYAEVEHFVCGALYVERELLKEDGGHGEFDPQYAYRVAERIKRDIALFLCDRLAEQQRWIPCSEKLPHVGENVLVWHDDFEEEMPIAYYHKDGYFREWRYMGPGEIIEHVSHWMPLPPQPSEKGQQ